VVVREALQALRDGQPRLVGLVGEAGQGRGEREGLAEYTMTCHSGGTLEIYVEPFLPRPRLVLVGLGPVVETLAALGRSTDFEVVVVGPEATATEIERLALTPRAAVVVATHGNFDEDALERALASEAGYVSLVASRKRAAAVVESLRRRGVPAERIGRLKAPAGLDLGAVTPEEIAVSILAEVIQVRRSPKAVTEDVEEGIRGDVVAPVTEALDPVCGMTVEIAGARHRSDFEGQAISFCCARCKQAFDADPARYAAAPPV
jgi:xanthine dehydrogenase accessory factor